MLQRHTEVRMQAAEPREQQAGCSGAAQPQGGRFPLCVSETHIHTHKHTHREHKTISVLQMPVFGLHNHFANKKSNRHTI